MRRRVQGWVDTETGEAELDFDATFQFTGFDAVYKAAPLRVVTCLTTEESAGEVLWGRGARLEGGRGRLVGVARVPRTDDGVLNAFLRLPTDALAVLSADITFE